MPKISGGNKRIETFTHDESTRKNIPTAEYQSIMKGSDEANTYIGTIGSYSRVIVEIFRGKPNIHGGVLCPESIIRLDFGSVPFKLIRKVMSHIEGRQIA
jgi:hypothetical protein